MRAFLCENLISKTEEVICFCGFFYIPAKVALNNFH